jgi:3-phosphoshikimate 1-carboxyvinyltransferase
MALPLTGETVTVDVVGELISKPYIEITLAIMARLASRCSATAGSALRSRLVVATSRQAPFMSKVMPRLLPISWHLGPLVAGRYASKGVGQDSIQGDVKFAEALAKMGACIEMGPNWMEARAPESGLVAVDLDCNHIPDAAMTLATTGAVCQGYDHLAQYRQLAGQGNRPHRGDGNRVAQAGRDVEEGEDFIRVTPASLKPAAIDTYDDHRIAMCFSLAAFGTPLRINDPKCVAKTFPDYFRTFCRGDQGGAGHRHRRPFGFRQRNGGCAGR